MKQKKRDFFLCYFESTRECNQDCKYCMTKRDIPSAEKELSTDEVKHLVIDEVKKICNQGLVAFSGGEFLLRKDALELLEYNMKSGLYAFINTNGEILTPELLSDIKKATKGKVIFGFSLDSIDENAHGETRSSKPEDILKLARMCDREKIGYFFLITITKLNMNSLDKTLRFLTKHNIPTLRSPFVPRGAGESIKEIAFDSHDMEKIINPALRANPLNYVSFTPFFASPEYMEKTWKLLEVPISTFGCQAARGFIGINAEGEVAPCVHLLDAGLDCGNVRKKPLSEILETDPLMKSLKDGSEVKGKCGKCRYKHSCRGCRALAFYSSGDPLGEDPTCFFDPEDGKARSPYENECSDNVAEFIRFLALNKPWNKIFSPATFRAKLKTVAWVIKTYRKGKRAAK